MKEKHSGLGEIHGIYKQIQAAKRHEGKIYIVCDNQGIIRTLQGQEAKIKFRKRIKEAYWNYTMMIQQIVEERKKEGRGETEFVWIKSHMSRNGVLNRKHTDQDRKAEEIAKDKERKAEDVPMPKDIWTLEDNKGLYIHSKIRKRAEKEIKDKIFQTFLDEEESTEYKRIDLKKAINKVETTNKETQESWKQAIEGKYGSRGLKYLLKIRQNKLLLRGRLQEIGIVQNGECMVCAQKATEEEKPIEDLRHIWRDCGIGRERKELMIERNSRNNPGQHVRAGMAVVTRNKERE